MAEQLKFPGTYISDQKRLARGEMLLRARSILRARDERHHKPWRVLTLAGGAPEGEINAIRELMPKAKIVAVDNDPRCLESAITAGADEIVLADLSELAIEQYSTHWMREDEPPKQRLKPHPAVAEQGPFDLMLLDLCAGVNETTRTIWRKYRLLLNTEGVAIFTFSYGRDVAEVYVETLRRARARAVEPTPGYPPRDNPALFEVVPDSVLGRLCYLTTPAERRHIDVVMTYRGNEMPMCCFLFSQFVWDRPNFVQVEPGDFELAVVYPEAANLYDCPRDRIDSLRRQFAAIKASITRRAG